MAEASSTSGVMDLVRRGVDSIVAIVAVLLLWGLYGALGWQAIPALAASFVTVLLAFLAREAWRRSHHNTT